MAEEERIHWPPQPSTPREAPWRELEAIADGLKGVTSKLDTLISLWAGVPPPPPGEVPGITPTPVIVPHKKTFSTGQRDVETTGEPVQLDDIAITDGYPVTIVAKPGNNGTIYYGKSQSECADNKRRFDGLAAGLADSLKIKNLGEVWIDSSVQGTAAAPEGVSWRFEHD